MDNKEDKNIYKKKQLNNNLDKILSQVTYFLNNCEKFGLEESELNNLIYTHSIYKNRGRISEFLNLINNSEEKIRGKVIELQEESEMRQKRKNEIEDLKNILNINTNNLIAEEKEKDNKNKLLLTKGEPDEQRDKTEDDVLIEDTKDVENRSLLKKKRKKEKEDETKEKYVYKSCYICIINKLIPSN